MVEEDDAAIVRQCLEGSRTAFETLVNKYQGTVFNVAFRMCNDYDDAADIAQTAFIKAYEKLRLFNPRYRFYSWIYRIAINETLNYLERKKHSTGLRETYEAKDDDPDKEYDQQELQQNIQEALMTLNPDYRILIVLKHFQNCSYHEISKMLHLSRKTVKSRLYTARQLLGKALIRKGIQYND